MKENVGRIDRIARFIVGPAAVAAGYTWLEGRTGSLPGLTAMLAGALIAETAITRVCPLNALLGIDTRSKRERERDLQDLLAPTVERTYERTSSGRMIPVTRLG